ncbi:unnamed protein product, partial [Iphiclides podalirius]
MSVSKTLLISPQRPGSDKGAVGIREINPTGVSDNPRRLAETIDSIDGALARRAIKRLVRSGHLSANVCPSSETGDVRVCVHTSAN